MTQAAPNVRDAGHAVLLARVGEQCLEAGASHVLALAIHQLDGRPKHMRMAQKLYGFDERTAEQAACCRPVGVVAAVGATTSRERLAAHLVALSRGICGRMFDWEANDAGYHGAYHVALTRSLAAVGEALVAKDMGQLH